MNCAAAVPAVLSVVEGAPGEGFAEIASVLLRDLEAFYDDVEPSLVDVIVGATRGDLVGASHFTHSKRIFTAYAAGQPVGFTVATFKRGGSVKTGPTIVLPRFRRQGYARALKRDVNERLRAGGARKLFSTVAAENWNMLLLSLQLGFEIEGILCGQYREGAREVVLGELLRPGGNAAPPVTLEPRALRRDVGSARSVIGHGEVAELASYLLPRLAHAFDDLDRGFIETVIAGCRESRADADRQPDRFLVRTYDAAGDISGTAVCVSKRGGALKIGPVAADSRGAAECLVDRCLAEARLRSRRKAYTTLPVTDLELVHVFRDRGFGFEARLREPYKAGVDALVIGRAL